MNLAFDIETDGLLKELTQIHVLVIQDLDTGDEYVCNSQGVDGTGHMTLSVEAGLELLANAKRIIGHNIINFDLPAIQKLYPEWKPKGEVYDTMVAARLIFDDIKLRDTRRKVKFPDPKMFGAHTLKAYGYRLGVFKGDFGETTDWKEWTQEMQDYCVQDVVVTEALYNRLQKEDVSQAALEVEHKFAEILSLQMRNGWQFNEAKAQELYAKLSIERQKIVDEIQDSIPPRIEVMKTPQYYEWQREGYKGIRGDTQAQVRAEAKTLGIKPLPRKEEFHKGPPKEKHHPFNPGSRDQIANYLTGLGWKPVKFTDGGKPKIDETTIGHLRYPHVDKIMRFLMLAKRLSQLVEGDGSMLNSLEKDGRMYGYVNPIGTVTHRCSHNHPNVGQTPNNSAEFGKEFRELYEATTGYKMLGYDGSGLQLRCLAHYLASYDGGEYAREVLDGDIHTKNQNAAGLPTRDNAKTFIYAFLFGAGDGKIGSIIGKGPMAGRKIKTKFFEATPAIKVLKEKVEAAAKKGYIKGWDGRIIKIRSSHSALNFLLQSLEAIIMKNTAVIFHEKLVAKGWIQKGWVRYCGHIHDEQQLEFRPEHVDGDELGQMATSSVREAGEKLGLRCRLDGEYKIGDNWSLTH